MIVLTDALSKPTAPFVENWTNASAFSFVIQKWSYINNIRSGHCVIKSLHQILELVLLMRLKCMCAYQSKARLFVTPENISFPTTVACSIKPIMAWCVVTV